MKVKHSNDWVGGTSADVRQRQIIKDNIATWRRERRKRAAKIEKREFVSHFNSVGDAMHGKRVFV